MHAKFLVFILGTLLGAGLPVFGMAGVRTRLSGDTKFVSAAL
jgi:hypothetical protein